MNDTDAKTDILRRMEPTLAGYELDQSAHRADQFRAGVQLGPYRLISPLGQGGMSTVWLAEQHQPLSRRVAIKLLTRRVEDSMSQAYFLIERQALAMLVHPDIAQIHDAGQLPDGTLFYVMEYVEGRDLLHWADAERPTPLRLVLLFERICHAVHHAHRRGLIHRDIKPGNLMVREIDGAAVPKIIDFGIAVSSGSDGRVNIDQRVAVGTLSYMAPEQAQPDEQGIDARVDVYALGVSLAVALAAARGIDVEGAQASSGYAASISGTGSGSHQALREVALALRRELPLELRAIASKAMAMNPAQRYDSAAAMAEELRRWRLSFPVQAVGQRRGYALRCFLRRHRWASAAAMVALLALISGLVAALHGMDQAREARAIAEERRSQAESLVGVMLGDLASKLRPLGQLELLETVGDEAMRYLGAAQSEQTSVGALQRAKALRTLAEVYFHRGRSDSAAEALHEARLTLGHLDEAEHRSMDALFESGQIAFWKGYLAFAAADYDTARRHLHGYAKDAESMYQRDPNARVALLERAHAAVNLGALENRVGSHEAAFDHFLRSIDAFEAVLNEHGSDSEVAIFLADSYSWVGSALQQTGRLYEALPWMQRRLSLMDQLLEEYPAGGGGLWHKGVALHMLALLEGELGSEEALDYMRQAESQLLETHLSDPGNRSWWRNLVLARSDLGWLLHTAGDSDQGLTVQHQAMDMLEADAGGSDPSDTRSLRLRVQVRRAEIGWSLGQRMLTGEAVAAAQTLSSSSPESLGQEAELARVRLLALECQLASSTKSGPELTICFAAPRQHLDDMPGNKESPARQALAARLALLAGDSEAASGLLDALSGTGYRAAEFITFLQPYQDLTYVNDYLSAH